MKIKWLFFVWGILLGCMGVMFFLLLPTSEYTFYVAEGTVVVCLSFLVYFYRKTVMPLHTIGNAMDLLSEQDFSSRLRTVGQRDADRIVHLFNRLMEQLKNERLHVREQNHFLDLLISVSPMGVILFDFNRNITSANAAALKFLGNLTEQDVLGRSMGEIQSALAEKLAQVAYGSVETVRLNDAMIYRCSHLSFIDRGYAHPFLLIESLTSEIVKAEKKTYEKVIRMIAHEVNNSVAGVTSTLDSLNDIIGTYDGAEELCHTIQICSDRCYGMNHFIARLAEIVRIPEPQLQTVSLNNQVDACRVLMENVCQRRQIRLHRFFDSCNPEVQLDPILFEQVLDAFAHFVGDGPAAGDDGGEVRLGGLDLHAVVGGVAGVFQHLRRFQERFRGDAAPVEANAPEFGPFDNGDVHS